MLEAKEESRLSSLNEGNFHYYAEFTTSTSLDDDEDPDAYNWVTVINGQIYAAGESGIEQLVGKCKYYYVDLETAAEHRYHPAYILDLDSETAPFMALYTNGYRFRKKLLRAIGLDPDWPASLNLLIGSRMEILPEFRGGGLSVLAKSEVFRLFANKASVTALMSYPLQFEIGIDEKIDSWNRMMRFQDLEKKRVKAQAALDAYYLKQGYAKYESGIMVKSLGY